MIGIDSNILIYAHNRASPYYNEAKRIIHTSIEEDLLGISEISLREFYAVITDGRKVDKPFTPASASILLKNYFQSKRVVVCQLTSEVWEKAFEYMVRYKVSRYNLDDLLIALTLWLKGTGTIYTRNTKDFRRFDFIEPINPFAASKTNSTNQTNSTNETKTFIPYGRQSIDEQDVAAVCSVLRSDWLTTGPKVEEFEKAVADYVGAKYAVAVSSGTAALHCAMYALSIGPGDEVIVPPLTFAATANCVVYQGGTPVFSDVEPDTLLLDPEQIESKITPNTEAIIAVDYAGHPGDYDALRKIADQNNLILVADACHALGAEYKKQKAGSLADLNIFSFHPVKHITTGEGGMITTDNADYANRMRIFRNHGITTDHHQREKQGSWFYEMVDLGYNYRITDFQCALGLSQLTKLPEFLQRRRGIAARYDEAFAGLAGINPLAVRPDALHAYHLYVVRVDPGDSGVNRTAFFARLHEKGVGVNVHYIPVHLHPFYREKFHTGPGLCPVAEAAYEQIISLPMFPGMTDEDVEKVIEAMKKAIMQ